MLPDKVEGYLVQYRQARRRLEWTPVSCGGNEMKRNETKVYSSVLEMAYALRNRTYKCLTGAWAGL